MFAFGLASPAAFFLGAALLAICFTIPGALAVRRHSILSLCRNSRQPAAGQPGRAKTSQMEAHYLKSQRKKNTLRFKKEH